MINMMVPLRTEDLLPEHMPALHFLARSDVSLVGSTTSGWLCYQVGSACNVYLKAGVLYSRYQSEGQAQTYNGLIMSELTLETWNQIARQLHPSSRFQTDQHMVDFSHVCCLGKANKCKM